MAPCGIGLGHITRCEPIAAALQQRGAEVMVSTYLDGLEYARNNGFRLVESVPIGFKVKEDGTIDFKMTAATSGFSLGVRRFLEQVSKEIKNLKTTKPDVVISDSRASSVIAAWLLRIPTILLINQFRVDIVRRPSALRLSPLDRIFFFIANLGWAFVRTILFWIWARSSSILIPDYSQPKTISTGNLQIPRRYAKKVKLIGPIVPVPPDRLPTQSALKRFLGFSLDRPLIYAAVSGPKIERSFLSERLINILSQFPSQYHCVLSKGDPDGSRTPEPIGNLLVYGWIERQLEFLKASDVVIGRGGHGLISKAIAYGKPLVLIPIPDHTEQNGNANRAKALGFATLIEQRALDYPTLIDAIESLTAQEALSLKTPQSHLPITDPIGEAVSEAISLASSGK